MLTQSPYRVIDHIVETLFAAENRRLTRSVDHLCKANSDAYGEKLDGFHYEGRFYRPEGLKGKLHRKVLHLSLHPRMVAHLKDEALIRWDEQMIRQTLFSLLDPCKSDQDMRDALPECITDTLGDAARLPRVNEEAFTILHNERALRQYHKVLPRLQVYSAARLVC